MNPSGGRGPEWGKAAPVALLIIALMGIALFVLIRSMNSQLRRVPSAFLRGATAAGSADEQTAAEVAQPVESGTPPGDPDPPARS